MGYSSSLLTPQCTPSRPEVVEASTPWSDILLGELRTTIQSDPPNQRGYGAGKFGSCRTRLRNQSRILWLTILVIVSLLWAVKGGSKLMLDENQLVPQPKLDGLQFIDANHPSIRVRQLIGLRSSHD